MPIKQQLVAHWPGGRAKALGVGEVRGSNPADSHIFYIQPHNQIMSDTWRPPIGPRVLTPFSSYMTRVTRGFDGHQPTKTCHVTTVRSYGLYGPATSDCTDWYSQHQIFFACLAWRTDHDIFFIRCPFDKVNIPPESGRRDGRNGTVFVAFRAL
jgi:hypothetical protein